MLKLFSLLCGLLFATSVFASSEIQHPDFKIIFDSFNKGKYAESIKSSEQLIQKLKKQTPLPTETLATAHYWLGLSYNKKEYFTKAIPCFEYAINNKLKANDLLYEYGKALSGSKKYKEAKAAFTDSLENKYQTAVSLYYLEFLARKTGEIEEEKVYQAKIEKLKPAEKEVALVVAQPIVQPTAPVVVEKPETVVIKIDEDLKSVYESFNTGLYARANKQLEDILLKIKEVHPRPLNHLGLIAYWQGLNYIRQLEYEAAVKSFQKAISYDFKASDLQYEYAQALYGAEKLDEAKAAFKASANQNYKTGVSLYYLGFLSQEMNEKKEAKVYYQQISTLPEEERKDVEQAAQMQIADITLLEVESHPDAVRKVEVEVIPQYEKAIDLDKSSNLAIDMKAKIRELQQKYELVLFKMRNNRPTQVPPYFMRASLDNAFDDNVVYSADETRISQSQKASAFTKADFMGRYSLYYKNIMSFAPELRTNRTRYLNRTDSIKANDNFAIVPAIRSAYEHSLWGRPASHLLDFEYNYAHRDLNSNDELVFSSRTQTYMIGERFNFFPNGESVVRYRQRHFNSYNTASNSITKSFVLEQILALKSGHMLILMGSYDMARNVTELFNTNALMTRADVIFPKYKDWFTMTAGLGVTLTDPYKNSARGMEKLINPSLKFTHTFSPRLRGTFRAEYWKNTSNSATFQYTKKATGIELEYIF